MAKLRDGGGVSRPIAASSFSPEAGEQPDLRDALAMHVPRARHQPEPLQVVQELGYLPPILEPGLLSDLSAGEPRLVGDHPQHRNHPVVHAPTELLGHIDGRASRDSSLAPDRRLELFA